MSMQTMRQRREAYCAMIQARLEEDLAGGDALRGVLFDAMRYSTLGSGKRLRAVLCLEFCRTACGDASPALPCAAAVEMIHAYSLIHDDLPCMDDDDLRRGKPACHIAFGEANALLAGDALLTKAFETVLENRGGPAQQGRVLRAALILARCAGADGMVGGQIIDLACEKEGRAAPETLRTLDALKTGALIRAACVMGAVVGGMDEASCGLAGRYADEIGVAFQIVDDILDATSTASELGKPVGSDKERGLETAVSLYGVDKAREMALECTRRAKQSLSKLSVKDSFLYDMADWLCTRSN